MFTIEEIARATGGEVFGSVAGEVSGISTDSRAAKADDLFIPLRGQRFDGHDYIAAAIARGVRVVLAESAWLTEKVPPAGVTVVAVPDTLRGLGDLASFHRCRFSLPVIGVTGSNGKTTTKEMLASILDRIGPGMKTAGNLNNLIGLPLMLLRLTGNERWAVLEMGMSEPGEIDRLAEIARPDVGVITNAFPAHLASMGSVEAVALAKGELFVRLAPGGWAVYNADDRLIASCPSPTGVHRLGFGLHGGEVSAVAITNEGRHGVRFVLRHPGGEFPLFLKAFGLHNVANALAAAATAIAMGIEAAVIREGLEAFTPFEKRFSLEELDGVILIDDSYNANPASMEAALTTLRGIKNGSRGIAVLGDMLELGPEAKSAHRALGKIAASCVELLYVTGEFADATAAGAVEGGLACADVIVAADKEEILAALVGNLGDGEYLLVKGSRGMHMEIVAEGVRRAFRPERMKGTVS